MTEGTFDGMVIIATSTGVTVATTVHETSGRTTSRRGTAKSDGNVPSCPVAAATASPARKAGRTGGRRCPTSRMLARYAPTATPTMIGSSTGTALPAASDGLMDEKIPTRNGMTAPAINPYTMGIGIHMAIRPVT